MNEDCVAYDAILCGEYQILDVRAPSEFERGSVPGSINLPILDDDEREQVGITYKKFGNQEAVQLGHQLVQGEVKERRIKQWTEFLDKCDNPLVSCWRGGMRSEIAQQWLLESVHPVPRVRGGFKAIRQRSIELFEEQGDRDWLVIAGQTGVGKTQLLSSFSNAIDLEGLANHRGSSFGRLSTPQPSPINFELRLARDLLQTMQYKQVLLEDESRTIGRLAIPDGLYQAMQVAPIVVLEATIQERVALTYEQYVQDVAANTLFEALERIRKRLGGARYQEIVGLMREAFESHSEQDHHVWIRLLLEYYYDPMYQYQLEQKKERVVYQGNTDDVRSFIDTYAANSSQPAQRSN